MYILKTLDKNETKLQEVAGAVIKPKRKITFSSQSVFLDACVNTEKELVAELLEAGIDINTTNAHGLSALHLLCCNDNVEMIKFLVEHGVDINLKDVEGWTPLHVAVHAGYLPMAKYLIENNAEIAAVTFCGDLPIDLAETDEIKYYITSEMKKKDIDYETVKNAEKNFMLNAAQNWLSTSSPLVHERDPNTGATPLHVAAAKGFVDVTKILLTCGAETNTGDKDGWTPLHAAVYWKHREIIEILYDSTDLNSVTNNGDTIFDLAKDDIVRFLKNLKIKRSLIGQFTM